ncbi:MAG: Multidrug resistance protein MdtN [Burkholderia plantarii]|nr:MAG: Multidrug resistance protein MdtN [Burkholderia plantarii]
MTNMSPHQKRYVAGAVVLAAAALCLAGFRFLPGGSTETTNDAFIDADFSVVAPRVAGQIAAVSVDDNQPVRRGQLLARIDDSRYRTALASAEADVAMAQATEANAAAGLAEQQAVIDQAGASVAAARANRAFASADFARYTDLAQHGAGSQQNAQQARAHINAAQAEVARTMAARAAAKQRVAVLQAERARARCATRRGSISPGRASSRRSTAWWGGARCAWAHG